MNQFFIQILQQPDLCFLIIFSLFWLVILFKLAKFIRGHYKSYKKSSVLFFAKSPHTIQYTTLNQWKDPHYNPNSIMQYDTQKFTKICGFKIWAETLYSNVEIKNFDIKTERECQELVSAQAIGERLQSRLTDLIICELDKKVGKGVFLAKNAAVIKEGTLLGIYAGELKNIKPKDPSYTLSLRGLAECTQHLYIDSKKIGNIFRFVQDLPKNEELDNSEVPLPLLKHIVTENIKVLGGWYQNYPVCAFVALKDILPGEQLGFSYGSSYWQAYKKKRCVFNQAGEVIGYFVNPQRIIEIKSSH